MHDLKKFTGFFFFFPWSFLYLHDSQLSFLVHVLFWNSTLGLVWEWIMVAFLCLKSWIYEWMYLLNHLKIRYDSLKCVSSKSCHFTSCHCRSAIQLGNSGVWGVIQHVHMKYSRHGNMHWNTNTFIHYLKLRHIFLKIRYLFPVILLNLLLLWICWAFHSKLNQSDSLNHYT